MKWLLALAGVVLFQAAATIHAAETPSPDKALSPGKDIIKLFNGRDLTGLYHWLKGTGREDPKQVFSVVDGMLRISGAVDGYIGTEQPYRDYHLVMEYKWARETYGAKGVRNSGILMHAMGVDGTADGGWITSIECQVAQGCVGDFIVIRGKDAAGQKIPATIKSETTVASDGNTALEKGGKTTPYVGKQFWWSLHEPGFEELIDTRGKADLESPLGEWTRIDCFCKADRISVQINGVTVNECFDVFPKAGKIMLESEGFELLVRKFELHPLDE